MTDARSTMKYNTIHKNRDSL